MATEPLPERGQRSCMNAREEKDGTIWCEVLDAVCSVSGKCSNYRPTLRRWMRD
jgi:hypothetical protein